MRKVTWILHLFFFVVIFNRVIRDATGQRIYSWTCRIICRTFTSFLLQVLALDEDAGANGEVEYTLMGGAEGYFNIDPVTGDIRVQRVMGLDVENRNFTLLVQASDKGKTLLLLQP